MKRRYLWMLSLLLWSCQSTSTGQPPVTPPNPPPPPTSAGHPILFITQVPVRPDFTTIGSTFGNHLADVQSATRGGDLWIRYPDGTLKNLTKAAGYGMEGFQGASSIAVRDPSVHWEGKKALFSMVVGSVTKQYEVKTHFWQIYEITGLGKNETPKITRVPNQPANYNNVSPIYGTDDRIIFTTDRPRSGEAHLYPQLDEYEEAPTVTGLWSLDPSNGNLKLLNHAPSGNFTPIIDSFGRVVFTQWDHLQRDQQADADTYDSADYGTFNYTSEAANAGKTTRKEVFPEPRAEEEAKGTNLDRHTFNQFFPWSIHEDGTEGEVLNHLGRHELHGYIGRSFNDDDSVIEYYGQYSRVNQNRLESFFQIKEDPTHPGCYVGIDAPEFSTHASGQVLSLCAPPGKAADSISVTYLTHRDTASYTEQGKTPSSNHSGHYRDPLVLQDGTLIAAHTSYTYAEANSGNSKYDFRLKTLKKNTSGYFVSDQPLTSGIQESITYWDPDRKISYSGPLWELQPVEVKSRPRPTKLQAKLPAPEKNVFSKAGVDVAAFQAYLKANNLALAVVRNVTTRDRLDKQQPFNLRVPGGVQSATASGKVYDVSFLQLFQADQIRGLGGMASPKPGRRVLAQELHDASALTANGGSNFIQVAKDGSVAAFFPVNRATTWQLTDPNKQGVVRERYWLTFQPGEIRVCSSCHGLSSKDQMGRAEPMNEPQALYQLLVNWKAKQ
ncbi:hypothetical protein [Deinococcus cellulosilyticus]|uniref:Hydrazine synthase alpha subunit middle domain-containing protein n=1 Tax=Deinococcus cellulosilyticus (strain DSM 18568 / NBRC 106333 / KACC 11606 / 5516J-15) TaxID=1223518 RepID=A0A511N5U9_DEIC1|nr:hypothetical protein [Deinococcus cellulosilyticus]GEM47848.1 hypothetical protein DC3_34830 [Deinococcus cellulosilyticus NBRC 106333 = KACC 11606]